MLLFFLFFYFNKVEVGVMLLFDIYMAIFIHFFFLDEQWAHTQCFWFFDLKKKLFLGFVFPSHCTWIRMIWFSTAPIPFPEIWNEFLTHSRCQSIPLFSIFINLFIYRTVLFIQTAIWNVCRKDCAPCQLLLFGISVIVGHFIVPSFHQIDDTS